MGINNNAQNDTSMDANNNAEKEINMDIQNNQVQISGTISSEFVFDHETFGEKFYMADVLTERLSQRTDIIPVMFSERLIDVNVDHLGEYMQVSGQFRSYNIFDDKGTHLKLYVFAEKIKGVKRDETDANQIFLDGFICKPPVYRKTPLGREIADMLVAVNRPYGKSDYIPCISWGRNARFASTFEVGGRVRIWGRIQSREYVKKIGEGETENKVAYEVSVSRICEVGHEED